MQQTDTRESASQEVLTSHAADADQSWVSAPAGCKLPGVAIAWATRPDAMLKGSRESGGVAQRARVTRDLHVVLVRKAEKNAGVGPEQGPRITTGMFGGFPGCLEQQPVLWIHGELGRQGTRPSVRPSGPARLPWARSSYRHTSVAAGYRSRSRFLPAARPKGRPASRCLPVVCSQCRRQQSQSQSRPCSGRKLSTQMQY
jgi:hypothetical protein